MKLAMHFSSVFAKLFFHRANKMNEMLFCAAWRSRGYAFDRCNKGITAQFWICAAAAFVESVAVAAHKHMETKTNKTSLC